MAMEEDRSVLRRRGPSRLSNPYLSSTDTQDPSISLLKNTQKHSLPSSTLFMILVVSATVYFALSRFNDRLPTPLTTEDEIDNPNRFIATRAMDHIKDITKLGPRVVGSFANEVLAVNVLNKKIDNIMQHTNKVHLIKKDDQVASGSFSLTFLEGLTSVYKNVKNIVVKIGPHDKTNNSILLNCHYDSVADSPGASDDAASCAVMLEVMRIISISDKPLVNSIIFLFNGAEENLMQGSHAFITQHKWAKEIKAFVNIESCGSGGRELLFQAGPEHPWLLEVFASSAIHPLANTLAEEIFQSGIIPADTDYRVFRDFGNIPGLDFAWTKNGYVYHTKLDNTDQIPLGSLQNTGDNILPLINNLAQLPINDKLKTEGNLVYFDVFGLFLVRVNGITNTLISCVVFLSSLFIIYYKSSNIEVMDQTDYIILIFKTLGMVIFAVLVSLLYAEIIAFTFVFARITMSWYSKPCWILFLYVIPAINVFFNLLNRGVLISDRNFYRFNTKMLIHQLYTDVIAVFAAIIILVCLLFNIRSGFLPTIWLAFFMLANFLKNIARKKCEGHVWAYVYLAAMSFPFLVGCYAIDTTLHIVVPIMGRTGAGNFSEPLIAFMFSLLAIQLIFFLIPIVVIVDDIRELINFLHLIKLVSVIVLILTPLGFPYSSNPISPAPQRYMIIHTSSEVYSGTSMLNYKSGFWIVNLDENSPHAVTNFVPEMQNALVVDDCDKLLFCGMPYLLPVRKLIWKTHWIPAMISQPFNEFGLSMNYNISFHNNIERMYFVAKGPDHMTVMISPTEGVKLVSWSLNNDKPLAGPKWNNRDTYFVYYSCAQNPEPWKFHIDFDVTNKTTKNTLDIAITAHYLHGANQYNVRLTKLLALFPKWTVSTGWTASYKSYSF